MIIQARTCDKGKQKFKKKKKAFKEWVDLMKILLKDQDMLHDQAMFSKAY